VEWCQLGTILYVSLDIIVDEDRFLEVFTAVRHPVTYSRYLANRLNYTVDGMDKSFHDHIDANGMVRYVKNHLVIVLSYWLMGKDAIGKADAFNEPFCQDLGIV